MQARILKCMFLPAELERGTKARQFHECCKSIDQYFDCGCDCYTILHLDWSSLIAGLTFELKLYHMTFTQSDVL